VLVNDTSSFSMDIATQGFHGLIGLGPDTGSIICKKYGKGKGISILFRVFEQDCTTDNYITFLLDRRSDPGNTVTGQFTVSELVPELQNITSTPKLNVDHIAGGDPSSTITMSNMDCLSVFTVPPTFVHLNSPVVHHPHPTFIASATPFSIPPSFVNLHCSGRRGTGRLSVNTVLMMRTRASISINHTCTSTMTTPLFILPGCHQGSSSFYKQ
jgi:hypothetical protein